MGEVRRKSRRRGRRSLDCIAAIAVLAIAVPTPAWAYVGPGAGLTAVGTVLALVAAVALVIAGFVWYPIKRLLRRRRPPNRLPEDAKSEPQR